MKGHLVPQENGDEDKIQVIKHDIRKKTDGYVRLTLPTKIRVRKSIGGAWFHDDKHLHEGSPRDHRHFHDHRHLHDCRHTEAVHAQKHCLDGADERRRNGDTYKEAGDCWIWHSVCGGRQACEGTDGEGMERSGEECWGLEFECDGTSLSDTIRQTKAMRTESMWDSLLGGCVTCGAGVFGKYCITECMWDCFRGSCGSGQGASFPDARQGIRVFMSIEHVLANTLFLFCMIVIVLNTFSKYAGEEDLCCERRCRLRRLPPPARRTSERQKRRKDERWNKTMRRINADKRWTRDAKETQEKRICAGAAWHRLIKGCGVTKTISCVLSGLRRNIYSSESAASFSSKVTRRRDSDIRQGHAAWTEKGGRAPTLTNRRRASSRKRIPFILETRNYCRDVLQRNWSS